LTSGYPSLSLAYVLIVPYGPALVALHAWEKQDLSGILRREGMNAGSIATAQLMVANRLIEPLSEWALIDWAAF